MGGEIRKHGVAQPTAQTPELKYLDDCALVLGIAQLADIATNRVNLQRRAMDVATVNSHTAGHYSARLPLQARVA